MTSREDWQNGPPLPPMQLWWWGSGPQRPPRDVAPATPVRIGDAERDQALSDLGDHFAAGRLTREEFDERSDRAMAARFSSDLTPLFADLPHSSPTPTAPPAAAGPARFGGPPPQLLWLLPVLVVAAIAGAVLLHAPFLIWILIWVAVIGKLTGHRRRYHRQQLPPHGWHQHGPGRPYR